MVTSLDALNELIEQLDQVAKSGGRAVLSEAMARPIIEALRSFLDESVELERELRDCPFHVEIIETAGFPSRLIGLAASLAMARVIFEAAIRQNPLATVRIVYDQRILASTSGL